MNFVMGLARWSLFVGATVICAALSGIGIVGF